MNSIAKLELLKQDLQLMTSAHDFYLGNLLQQATKAVQTEGIKLVENDIEIDMAVIQYAAYLFRKRGAAETSMPRYLRWQLNNIIIKQKGAKK